MKKLVTLLFMFALAFTLSMPVFAQDSGATEGQTQEAPKATKKAHHKAHKATKAKKAKKEKKEKKSAEAQPEQ